MAESSSNSDFLPDGEEEDAINLNDIIKEEEEIMEEVAAVLGGGDDFNCSYNQGYMKRQPLYACYTCIPDAKDDYKKAAGICLACSYHCHDGHNLIELYTKRNFRCDCGNLKFGDAHCNLDANKDDYNYDNVYNQNFSGVYCTCAKVYPDPTDDDIMIQCTICEDWYHSRHLNITVVEGFSEMICETCVKCNDFLLSYIGNSLTTVRSDESDDAVYVEGENIVDGEDAKAETSSEEKEVGESSLCMKPKLKEMPEAKTMLMNASWRKQLCQCEACLLLYKEKKVEYLLDDDDTVEVYENKGKEKYNELKQKAMDAEKQILNTLPRAKALDAIAGLNHFKDQLAEYLKKMSAEKRVITVEDINDFMSKMQASKRPRTDDSYYCH